MLFFTSITAMSAEMIGSNGDYAIVESEEGSVSHGSVTNTVNTGDILSPVESVEEQLAELSAEQRAMAIEKFNDEGSEIEVVPYAATWEYLDGFAIYKQSESYYCVVASCKAAMQYLTGASDSQDNIAKDLGTTTSGTSFGNARTYLNSHQSRNAYISRDASTSQSTMEINFYSAIHTYDAPPLISVKLSTIGGWAYNASAHTMCIAGARSDKAYFYIADPYIKWVDEDTSMFYSKSSSEIYTAISDRGNGYIF